jgi:hypothetical protein
MVLTGAMRTSDRGHSRRQFLGAGLAVTALSGCSLLNHDPDPAAPPDPLQPLVDEALALAIAYDQTAVSLPDLAARIGPLAADHRAHAAELVAIIGRTTPTSGAASTAAAPSAAPGADTGAVIAEFRAAEQTAAKNAAAACKSTSALRAGLVGSIAASRATHVEALR